LSVDLINRSLLVSFFSMWRHYPGLLWGAGLGTGDAGRLEGTSPLPAGVDGEVLT